jgi:ABC-2 type transport system permease protein
MTAIAYESYYLGARTIRRFVRVPANFSFIVFPLILLLVFGQLFEAIIQLPGFGRESSYLAYLAPGQIALTAFLAVAWSAYGLMIEYRTGYVDKLRASPIRHWSILVAEMAPLFFQAALMSGIVLGISVVLGAGIATGFSGALVIVALSGLFGVAIAGASFFPALLTRTEQATSLSILLFPLIFGSTAFMPQALMPAWLQVVNDWNPITHLVEAIRALMVTGFDWALIGRALLSIAIVGAALQAATLWAFARLAR